MKAFLVSISSLCLCGILLCFFRYTMGRLPGITPSQQVETSQVALNPDEIGVLPPIEADPLCSPCVERIALMLEMIQEWEAETAQFARVPTSQSRSEATDKSGQVELATEEECSPCEEKRALILEMIEKEWEADMTAFLEQSAKPSKPAAHGWVWLSSTQREQAQQLIDQYGTEEGLRRLREVDSEAARQFEQEQSALSVRDEVNDAEFSTR